jgi:uncharacterized protein (DUF58 family)
LDLRADFRNVAATLKGEAWIRFFVALAMLVIAFSSAVLSTMFREEGNVIGTAVTASLALLMAGLAGLVTVPYLARRVALERVRYAMQYDVTREGVIYIVSALVIAIAALNTGNNLLFIIVAAMLAAVVVSGIFSTLILLNLQLDITIPEPVFARQSVTARIAVRNQSRFPGFSVSVVPQNSRQKSVWKWQRETLGVPPGREPRKQWFHLPDLKLKRVPVPPQHPPILRASVYFTFLPAREVQYQNAALFFDRRGRYLQKDFGLSTRFPFSFLRKTRILPLDREILVLPPVEATADFMEVLPAILGELEAYLPGRGHDLYRIREYAPGDPARHIDWKASARAQGMMVREFTREDDRRIRLVFDSPAPGSLTPDEYERAVQLAASLAWHFARMNSEVSFFAPGYDNSPDVISFLRYLAVIEAEGPQLSLADIPRGTAFNVVITSRPGGSIPPQIWASSYFVFVGQSKLKKSPY